MSMLAEPRRKQKWSIDPRNSTWSKDESKFGQKMLERMGWSKGKGLGRTEQGSTDHIKVKVKNNNLGLGTNASQEDNWIAHQDDFNQLLADLNSCHGQPSTNEPPPEEKQGFSLEEKSKTSKKRVHYMKFTKGKDLSSRSQTDLACIFGRRGAKQSNVKEDNIGQDSPEEEEEEKEGPPTAATPTLDVESITKTVTSTLSMQEYFAQRMAQLKKGRGKASSPEVENSESQASRDAVHNTTEGKEETKSKKKKKKKRKDGEEEEVAVKEECVLPPVEEECVLPPVEEECEDPEQASTERKKKKRKRREKDASAPSGLENCEEDQPPTDKKKKKHKGLSAETELLNGFVSTENIAVDPEVVNKKKKKRRERVEEVVVVEEEEEVVVVEDDDEEEVVEVVVVEEEEEEEEDEVVVVEEEEMVVEEKKSKKDKKKKKKKKKKDHD